MTIIQAQPLRMYGISGPSSALDNEVPVFDGTSGKKVKGGGGIGWTHEGDRDFDERLVLRKRILRDDEDILSLVGAIIPYLH